MARAAKTLIPAASTSVALIDEELNNEVALLRTQLGSPSGNKLRLHVQGTFSTPEGLDLGDEIQIVVVDFMTRHFYYSNTYNPDSITPPDCYAMGKDKSTLAPEADSPKPQSETCASCEMNKFGTGANGKSKACQNRYWLACLLVDPDNPAAHNEPDAPLYILDLSPSNLGTFEGAVRSVARTLGSPIKAIFTVRARNVGTYASLAFSSPIANPDYALHTQRRAETVDILTRKPDYSGHMPSASNARSSARRPGVRR